MYKYKRKGEKPPVSVKDAGMKINADFSSLQKPVDTSASDLYQVCKLLENGTEEVKSILSYECDIIYECRTCHSLYRSIINLLSHKRVYCREKFDITQKIVNKSNVNSFKETTIHMSETGQTKIEIAGNSRILRSQVSKEMKKRTDLTAVIERLNKKIQKLHSMPANEPTQERAISREMNYENIYLKPISTTSYGVYQTIKPPDNAVDLLKEQATAEVENFRNRQVAISQDQVLDNQVEKSDSPIQADMSDEENKLLAYRLSSVNTLACTICNAEFSSKKTLTFHMKSLHTSKRKCYYCPFCRNTFTNKWSVYRHLSKIHKKTRKQVRNLKPQIQLAVLHKDVKAERKYHATTKNGRETSKNLMNDNVVSQKDDAMNHVEEPNVSAQCSGKPNSKKTESASVPVYPDNHRPEIDSNLVDCTRVQDDEEFVIEEVLVEEKTDVKDVRENTTGGFLRNSDTSSDPDLPQLEKEETSRTDVEVASVGILNRLNSDNLSETDLPQLDGKQEISRMDVKVAPVGNSNRSNGDKNSSDVDLSHPDEKETVSQMNIKIASYANFRRLKCLICNRKFTSIPNLRRHVAFHIDWFRYRCKLCDFQSFTRFECKSHLTKHHDVENNSATIEEMIVNLPSSNHPNDGTIPNLPNERERLNNISVTSEEEKTNEPVVADVSAASCNPETHADSNNPNDLNALTASRETTVANEGITDSYSCNVRHDSNDDAHRTAMIEKLKEYMMSHDPGKLNKNLDHSDLKQMVMEMIVGSNDSDPSIEEEKDPEKFGSQTDDHTCKRADARDNGSNISDKSKEANPRPVSDHFKHQRPARNRVRPLSDDFIYDLKEIPLKRECAFHETNARKKTK